jgi:hypothetical protein
MDLLNVLLPPAVWSTHAYTSQPFLVWMPYFIYQQINYQTKHTIRYECLNDQ